MRLFPALEGIKIELIPEKKFLTFPEPDPIIKDGKTKRHEDEKTGTISTVHFYAYFPVPSSDYL